MASLEEQLSSINSKLAKIEATGENTLAECRKTNGRVTKLEDSHNETKLELAVLEGGSKERVVFAAALLLNSCCFCTT